MYVILTVRVQWLIRRGPEVILEWRDSHCVRKYGGDADLPLVVSRDVVIAYPYLRGKRLGTFGLISALTIIIQFYATENATKSGKWNGAPRLECVNGRHPPSKTPVGVLPWIYRSEGK